MPRFHENEKISGFEIQSQLGSGGFAEAYRARDLALGRYVVIKCLREDLKDDVGSEEIAEEFRSRFLIEARAQARLNHANACTIFAIDEKEKIIVMEFVDGETLESRRKRHSLTKKELIDIVIAVAETVAEAHRQRVLHRDLTLKNIMVTPSNQVKVLDFGLAKLMDEPPFTRLAFNVGTPGYMSPEQQRSKDLDERSDVFSLGVVIYGLVTNQLPYPSRFKDEPEPNPPPPFESFGCESWPDLYLLVRTALQLKPEDRFQSMDDMLQALLSVGKSLMRTEKSLSFFDTSILLEVICPAAPTKAGRQRAKRAKYQFEINHAAESAITSTSVLTEVIQEVARIYFECRKRGLRKDAHAQSVVADAKSEVLKCRQRAGRGGLLSWEKLNWDEKAIFLSAARGLFRPRLQAVTAQFAVVEVNSTIFLSKYLDLDIDDVLPERDSHILSEAYSLQATWLYSLEQRYRRKAYRRLLKLEGDRYRLGPSNLAAPSRRTRRAPVLPEDISTIEM